MRKRARTFTPSLDGLFTLLAGRAARTREALSAAGVKGVEARRLNALKRRRAVWSRNTGGIVGRGWVERRLALPGWQVLAARMVPGEWYALADMQALLPEYALPSGKVWAVKLRRLGITERTRNPDFDESRAPGLQSEPQWLHRLTVRGAELSKTWRDQLDVVSGLNAED